MQQQEADRAKGVATPAQAASAVGGLVGDAVVKPALRTGQFVKGAALGVQSIFDHIASGLAANEAMNGLLLRLENPKLTKAQRDVIIDQMEDTERILVDESPLYKVYKEVLLCDLTHHYGKDLTQCGCRFLDDHLSDFIVHMPF